jgi:hypothetical protein
MSLPPLSFAMRFAMLRWLARLPVKAMLGGLLPSDSKPSSE